MTTFSYIDGRGLDPDSAHKLVVGCVVPRPIAWVTTVDQEGRVNAAPFSSYNYVSTSPTLIAINIEHRDGQPKDTARNIRESGEFVVNVVTEANMELMHHCAWTYGPDESEVDLLGIELLLSRCVSAPRIASTPVQMECRLHQALILGNGSSTLFVGEVVAFHLSEEIFDGRRIDSAKMRPLARLGGPFYAALGEIFHRPFQQ
ncbi:flavin reductase family protein [Pseudomonas putida]|uniref:flavin reductase family protein n=1 Tax=Pseudomonas putida TaxID=303 RepID=UPI00370BF10D